MFFKGGGGVQTASKKTREGRVQPHVFQRRVEGWGEGMQMASKKTRKGRVQPHVFQRRVEGWGEGMQTASKKTRKGRVQPHVFQRRVEGWGEGMQTASKKTRKGRVQPHVFQRQICRVGPHHPADGSTHVVHHSHVLLTTHHLQQKLQDVWVTTETVVCNKTVTVND